MQPPAKRAIGKKGRGKMNVQGLCNKPLSFNSKDRFHQVSSQLQLQIGPSHVFS